MFTDIDPTGIHLPKNIWLFPISYITEDFGANAPKIQNLDDMKSEGFGFADFIDEDTIEFKESKEIVKRRNLTPTGGQTSETFMLSGGLEIKIPINAFNYQLYAIMQGMNPDTAVINDADIRLSEQGYTDDQGTVNPTFDGQATMVDRVETIVTEKFGILAEVIPEDASLGTKYILGTKVSASKQEIMKAIQKDSYSESADLESNVLTDAELTRYQNIFPKVKKSIPFYEFSVKIPAS